MSLPERDAMRSITTSDLHAIAGAILPLHEKDRPGAARGIIRSARNADKTRKRLGHALKGCGDGTLYAAAEGHAVERFNTNSTEHLKALHVAIGEIIADREEA